MAPSRDEGEAAALLAEREGRPGSDATRDLEPGLRAAARDELFDQRWINGPVSAFSRSWRTAPLPGAGAGEG